ncbi:MAG: ribonuclease D [Propionibacteriales bacterium]|nr:ribonuclease D [Propionibacteriales bacterium]
MTSSPDSPDPQLSEPDDVEVPLLELRDGLPLVVDTSAGVAQVAAAQERGSGPVALDAERASGYRFSQRAYLVQLRREGVGTALVDPADLGNVPNESLRGVADAIADAEWIIHAASQDLLCLAEVGMRPRRIFDTELAGRLLNYPRVGLAVLVEELLGYRMRKEHSAVDWSRRPLPEPWLLYAALDVEMLIELRDVLAAQLEEAGKTDWAWQEFAAWAEMAPAAPRVDPWRRTAGMHRVRGRRGLALVRELWQTRDGLARDRDVTPTRILPDAAIVEAAQVAPSSRSALGRLKTFGSRGGQRYVREFADAIARAKAMPDPELPPLAPRQDGPPPPRSWAAKHPEAAHRLTRCRDTVAQVAEEHEVPQENLLSPDVVRRLAWTPPDPVTVETVATALEQLGARPWQRTLTSGALVDALLG